VLHIYIYDISHLRVKLLYIFNFELLLNALDTDSALRIENIRKRHKVTPHLQHDVYSVSLLTFSVTLEVKKKNL